jgi:BON domain
MALLNRRARVAVKTARTGIATYGKVKHAQGARHASGRRGLATGMALGALLAVVLERALPRLRRTTPERAPRREPLDDVTLTRKVETEIFRDRDAPKGRVSVNTENGVVYLRGELEPEQIRHLVDAAGRVDGVQRVESLLHPPGTPAPHRS